MDKFLKRINLLKIIYGFYFLALVLTIIWLAFISPKTFRTLKRIRTDIYNVSFQENSTSHIFIKQKNIIRYKL